MKNEDFLLELGCAELPPSFQYPLAQQMGEQLKQLLDENRIAHHSIKVFASPRRLAVIATKLAESQTSHTVQRLGPSIDYAYDRDGTPTMACMGFASSCNISADQLTVVQTQKGERVCAIIEEAGKPSATLLPELITHLIKKLHFPKPMYWGEHNTPFIRPVQWVVMLHGETTINTSLFDLETTNASMGHRFHYPKVVRIRTAKEYSMQLYSQGFVVADFNERKKKILKQINTMTDSSARALVDPNLLDEVTALVEWPVVLKGQFNKDFLGLPREALITSMKTHQKCFPMEDANNQLLSTFLLVSNIESSNPSTVITGNERVINARLSDAAFFYHKDCQHPLSKNQIKLATVLFQKKLGSLQEKAKRTGKLASWLAKIMDADADVTKRAAQLYKCDLVTDMVVEFPSLQGIMGYYYALNDGEDASCALAIKEHYLPRFAKDSLPTSAVGAVLAVADRLDTLVGIMGIDQTPTGDKDPYALRRASLGLVRIIIEKKIPVDILEALKRAEKSYGDLLSNKDVTQQAFDFILTRLKAWYLEQDVSPSVFAAVAACGITQPYDFHQRIQAVEHFKTLPEAQALAQANKRVTNLLKKQTILNKTHKVDSKLFDAEAEHALAEKLKIQQLAVQDMLAVSDYTGVLTHLANLQQPVDHFFDTVMVMDEDAAKCRNRLCLLSELQDLFLQVADISLLQP